MMGRVETQEGFCSFPLNSAGESGSFKMELPWEEVQASSWALVLTLPDQCLVLRGSWGPQDRGVEGRSSRGLSRGQALRPSLRLQDDKPKRLWAPPRGTGRWAPRKGWRRQVLLPAGEGGGRPRDGG